MLITHYRQTPIIEKVSSSTLFYQSHLLFIGNSFQTTEPVIYNLVGHKGFEPLKIPHRKCGVFDRFTNARYNYSVIKLHSYMVAEVRIELTTLCASNKRSTIGATQPYNIQFQ